MKTLVVIFFTMTLVSISPSASKGQTGDEMLESYWYMPILGHHISRYESGATMKGKGNYELPYNPLGFIWGYHLISGTVIATNSGGFIHTFTNHISINDWDEVFKRASCVYGNPDIFKEHDDGTIMSAWLTYRLDFRLIKLPALNSVWIVVISKALKDQQ